jgi:hypothetical protein
MAAHAAGAGKMSDETFEDEASVDEPELAEEDIDDDDLVDEELEADDEDLDDLALDGDLEVVVEDETVARVVEPPVPAKGDDEDDEDVVDLDEELHPDDVEAPLDALLQEKTAAAKMEDEEEELEDEEPESDDRVDGPARIVPRRPGEFLCSSCFLVLPRNQLQDEERMLCRDCA